MMKPVTIMTRAEREFAFKSYIEPQVKSASRYINALEKGFLEAPVLEYESIYDISDYKVLEDYSATEKLRCSSVFTRKTKGGTAGLAGLNWYIRFLKDSRDSYYNFMNHFNIKPEDLFKWGMDAIIFPPKDQVDAEWGKLKARVFDNKEVFIRSYGRDGKGTSLYVNFYKYWLDNTNIKVDKSNNTKPQKNIKKMTGLVRNKDIYNYQVSHIWGRTKNIFLFEAPWNICYTPKIIDPFTGHETKGDLPGSFQDHFLRYAQNKYRKYIIDYNSIIESYDIPAFLQEYCRKEGVNNNQFMKNALSELSSIPLL